MSAPTHLRVLGYVCDYVDDNGYPPTRREIQSHFGWSSNNSVTCHIERLENKGLLIRGDLNAERAMRVTDAGRDAVPAKLGNWNEVGRNAVFAPVGRRYAHG